MDIAAVYFFGFTFTTAATAGLIVTEDAESYKAIVMTYQLFMFFVVLAAAVLAGLPAFKSVVVFGGLFLLTQVLGYSLLGIALLWPRLVYAVRLTREKD